MIYQHGRNAMHLLKNTYACDLAQLKCNIQHKAKATASISTHTVTTHQVSPSQGNKTCLVNNRLYHEKIIG